MPFPELDFIKGVYYLLPGFVAAWVFYGLTAHPQKTPFERGIQALVFTAFTQPISFLVRFFCISIGNRYRSFGPWTEESTFLASLTVALGLGFLFSVFANNGWPHSWFNHQAKADPRKPGLIARRLPWFANLVITKKTTAPSEWWSTFHNNPKRWVVLHLTGQRRLYGYPVEYPDYPDTGHFVISGPRWLLDDNREVELFLTEYILIPAKDVVWVELLKAHDEEITATPEQFREAEAALLSVQEDGAATDADPKFGVEAAEASIAASEATDDGQGRPVQSERQQPAASSHDGVRIKSDSSFTAATTAAEASVIGNGKSPPAGNRRKNRRRR